MSSIRSNGSESASVSLTDLEEVMHCITIDLEEALQRAEAGTATTSDFMLIRNQLGIHHGTHRQRIRTSVNL